MAEPFGVTWLFWGKNTDKEGTLREGVLEILSGKNTEKAQRGWVRQHSAIFIKLSTEKNSRLFEDNNSCSSRDVLRLSYVLP